jgi:selenocysteine lyase/cysteine desulfurase
MIFSHIDGAKNKEVQKFLEEKKIYIAVREGFLRVSPHIYNNYSDAEQLAEALNSF